MRVGSFSGLKCAPGWHDANKASVREPAQCLGDSATGNAIVTGKVCHRWQGFAASPFVTGEATAQIRLDSHTRQLFGTWHTLIIPNAG